MTAQGRGWRLGRRGRRTLFACACSAWGRDCGVVGFASPTCEACAYRPPPLRAAGGRTRKAPRFAERTGAVALVARVRFLRHRSGIATFLDDGEVAVAHDDVLDFGFFVTRATMKVDPPSLTASYSSRDTLTTFMHSVELHSQTKSIGSFASVPLSISLPLIASFRLRNKASFSARRRTCSSFTPFGYPRGPRVNQARWRTGTTGTG